jgi:hypothetical protein
MIMDSMNSLFFQSPCQNRVSLHGASPRRSHPWLSFPFLLSLFSHCMTVLHVDFNSDSIES